MSSAVVIRRCRGEDDPTDGALVCACCQVVRQTMLHHPGGSATGTGPLSPPWQPPSLRSGEWPPRAPRHGLLGLLRPDTMPAETRLPAEYGGLAESSKPLGGNRRAKAEFVADQQVVRVLSASMYEPF